MITISSHKETIKAAIQYVNDELPVGDKKVNEEPIFCVDEKHATKALKDIPGIQLLCKYPTTDTKVKHIDNFSEDNDCLIYILEKWNEGQHSNSEMELRYEQIQRMMALLKTYLMEKYSEKREELSTPFHTEYEYQQFGSFYGLSISFQIRDFNL